MEMTKFEKAEQLIKENELDDALDLLGKISDFPNDESKVNIYLLKGMIFHKQQKWGELINQYNEVLEIDPENSVAKTGIEMAKSILGFYNPDMFNP